MENIFEITSDATVVNVFLFCVFALLTLVWTLTLGNKEIVNSVKDLILVSLLSLFSFVLGLMIAIPYADFSFNSFYELAAYTDPRFIVGSGMFTLGLLGTVKALVISCQVGVKAKV